MVIVNLHWGTEFSHSPDAFQTSLARRLGRSRAITAVVGQHAHVVQPIRRAGKTWVVYGTGNLLSNQTAACCPAATQDGMLVRLRLRVGPKRARVERVTYVPTWVRHPDYTILRAARRGRVVAANGVRGRAQPSRQAAALRSARSTVSTKARTTAGSNCVPAQRRSSSSASACDRAAR